MPTLRVPPCRGVPDADEVLGVALPPEHPARIGAPPARVTPAAAAERRNSSRDNPRLCREETESERGSVISHSLYGVVAGGSRDARTPHEECRQAGAGFWHTIAIMSTTVGVVAARRSCAGCDRRAP